MTALDYVSIRYAGPGERLVMGQEGNELLSFRVGEIPRGTGWVDFLNDRLANLICDSCGGRLVAREYGTCGLCEADNVRDLLAWRGEFHDGLQRGEEAG